MLRIRPSILLIIPMIIKMLLSLKKPKKSKKTKKVLNLRAD
jgi:hypothetical protein